MLRRRSLNIFPFDGKIRQTIRRITEHPSFEWVMVGVIIICTFQLALDNPLLNPNDLLPKVLTKLDVILTIIFCIEALLKVISIGFIACGPYSYIRNKWNCLDFAIVIISVSHF